MLGEGGHDVDIDGLRVDLAAYVGQFKVGSFSDIELGPMLDKLIEIAARHGIRLPASLAMTGKAFGQMQLAVAELDPEPRPVLGRRRVHVPRAARAAPGRIRPAALDLREPEAEGAGDAAHRGDRAADRCAARPGTPDRAARKSRTLEDAIRKAGRRIALAFAGGATLLAAVLAAAAESIDLWVPITLGVAAGIAGLALVLDLRDRARA